VLIAGCTKNEAKPGNHVGTDDVPGNHVDTGDVKVVTDESFEKDIATGITLVDFWSPQCPPCLRQGPIVEEIAEDFAGSVRVGKLDVSQHRNVAMRLGITMIPTLMVFKDGKKVEQLIGLRPKKQLAALLEKYVKE